MERTGQVNRYECDLCKWWFYTINLNDGVTAFSTRCHNPKDCNYWMYSTMYRFEHNFPEMNIHWAWYRPDPKKQYNPLQRDHLLNGGLILAPLSEALLDVLRDDPICATLPNEENLLKLEELYG